MREYALATQRKSCNIIFKNRRDTDSCNVVGLQKTTIPHPSQQDKGLVLSKVWERTAEKVVTQSSPFLYVSHMEDDLCKGRGEAMMLPKMLR